MKIPKNIADVLVKQKGTITSQDISALGISRTMLGRYVSAGLLERVGRGLYTGVDSLPDEIYALAKRNDKIVFSHATALFLLGRCERTPFNHYVTVKSGDTIPVSLRKDLICFYVKDELFDIGRREIETQFGNIVPCYNLERTICDLIRNRRRMDEELFLATIKAYAADKSRNISRLGEYAQCMGIEEKVNKTLEVIL